MQATCTLYSARHTTLQIQEQMLRHTKNNGELRKGGPQMRVSKGVSIRKTTFS